MFPFLARFDAPGWRLTGSAVSWAAFTFSFLGLFQAAGVVMGLGGSCASGGPYAIETECPDAVILFAPGGIFGMFLAAGIALIIARGFGVSLLSWAWPILFIGLGIQFLLAAVGGIGIVTNILCGVLFVVMGAVPVWYFVSSRSVAATVLGSVNLRGRPFAAETTPRPSFGLRVTREGEPVAPTTGDWMLSIGLWLIAVTLGTLTSYAAFAALTTSPA